jgi:hypothetical protein
VVVVSCLFLCHIRNVSCGAFKCMVGATNNNPRRSWVLFVADERISTSQFERRWYIRWDGESKAIEGLSNSARGNQLRRRRDRRTCARNRQHDSKAEAWQNVYIDWCDINEQHRHASCLCENMTSIQRCWPLRATRRMFSYSFVSPNSYHTKESVSPYDLYKN